MGGSTPTTEPDIGPAEVFWLSTVRPHVTRMLWVGAFGFGEGQVRQTRWTF